MKASTSSWLNPRYVAPSGLLIPQQILASNLLQAIPHDAVNPVISFI